MKLILLGIFGFVLGINGGFVTHQTFKPDEAFDVLKYTNTIGSYMEFGEMTGSIGEKTFENLKEVESIRIYSGNLTSLDFKAFSKMPLLKTIVLNGVKAPIKITKEDMKASPNLKTVKFFMYVLADEKDKLIEEDAFANTNLEELYISHVSLKHLTKSKLAGLKNLKVLSIEFGDLENIDKNAFEDVPNLETINLLGNKAKIEPGTLDNLKKLNKLSLRNNGITKLNWESYKGLENLKDLDLYLNKFQSIEAPPQGVEFKDLEELDLSMGELTGKIDWNFLKSMPNLKNLKMHTSDIKAIDNMVIPGGHNLGKLDLSSNEITSFDWDFLKNFPHLKTLELESNNLKEVDADKIVTHLKELKEISLYRNDDLTCQQLLGVQQKLTEAIKGVKVVINYPGEASSVDKKC